MLYALPFFIITATNGVGKTTLCANLKHSLNHNHCAVHDIDEDGVPHDADQAWRINKTQEFIQRAVSYSTQGRKMTLCGQIAPAEIAELLQHAPDLSLHCIFLQLDDESITKRLIARQWSDQLIQDNLNWAAVLHKQALTISHHKLIDTSSMSQNQLTQSVIDYIYSSADGLIA